MDSMSFEELYYQVTLGVPMSSFIFHKGKIEAKGVGINPGPMEPTVTVVTDNNEVITIPYHELNSWAVVNSFTA